MFSATPVEDTTPGHGHFRVSFSNSTVSSSHQINPSYDRTHHRLLQPEELKKAVTVFGSALRNFMKH